MRMAHSAALLFFLLLTTGFLPQSDSETAATKPATPLSADVNLAADADETAEVQVTQPGANLSPEDLARLPQIGEEFTYAVDFTGVVGAYIKVKVGEGPAHQPGSRVLTAYIATTPLIKEVWRIRDKVMALYDPLQGRSLATRLWEDENGKRMFREEHFEENAVRVVEKHSDGQKDSTVASTQPVLDAFSALFELRRRPLLDDSVETAKIYLNRKIYDCQAKVKYEKLSYQGEEVATIRVDPELRLQGKVVKGVGFSFWLSDDARRIPLRIVADINYGKLAGTLLPSDN